MRPKDVKQGKSPHIRLTNVYGMRASEVARSTKVFGMVL